MPNTVTDEITRRRNLHVMTGLCAVIDHPGTTDHQEMTDRPGMTDRPETTDRPGMTDHPGTIDQPGMTDHPVIRLPGMIEPQDEMTGKL